MALKAWYVDWMLQSKAKKRNLIEDVIEDTWEKWVFMYKKSKNH